MYISPLAIALSVAVNSIFAMAINAWPNRKLINYSLAEQWKDLFPQFILAICMSALVALFGKLNINIYLLFFGQVVFGIVVYIGLSKMLKLEAFSYAERTIKDLLKKS